MKNTVFTSPAAQSPVQAQNTNQGVKNMKKTFTTLALATVIAISAFIINPGVAQSPKNFEANISNFNFLTTQGTDDWDGGITTQGTDDWDGGITTQGTDDWDGGYMKTVKRVTYY